MVNNISWFWLFVFILGFIFIVVIPIIPYFFIFLSKRLLKRLKQKDRE